MSDPANHDRAVAEPREVLAATALILGGWMAAGSTGLLAHSLRHMLSWLCFAAALVAVWPGPPVRRLRLLILLSGALAAISLTASSLRPVNVFAVAVLTAACASTRQGPGRRVLTLCALALCVFGIYRLAVVSIPFFWFAVDTAGGVLGRLAGGITGFPLWIGSTFAGLDYLVVMLVLFIGWLVLAPRPGLTRALWAAAAILGGHLCYLIVLSCSPAFSHAQPENSPEQWTWSGAVGSLLPWNLPLLAACIHLLGAGCLFRWSAWREDEPAGRVLSPLRPRVATWVGLVALALLVPAATVLSWGSPSLKDKKVVVYEKGFLNWLKPEHGQYGRLSIGMYGMLPRFIESLGGRCLVSPDLSEEALRDASIVILLYPNEPWADGQLQRMEQFVRRGGSLLVFGEHTVRESDGGSRFNDVLKSTAMRVRFDSATFEVGGWLQSYDALAHPATSGVPDDRNQFGVVIGASIDARWPARPVLVGRWGWSDPGDPGTGPAMMGNHRYDPGEELGDIVLMAEQRVGRGRVVVFGDTSSITNGITLGGHVFTSRLLGYLAGAESSPQEPWRGVLGLGLAAGLVWLVIRRRDPAAIGVAALALAASLWVSTAVSARTGSVPPDGRAQTPNALAYIDISHIEAHSEESWRDDGTMGIAMTLMRNGYLTLDLPEFTRDRLLRAGLLLSIAPAREFSGAERRMLKEFVEQGGIFVCTVGYDDAAPSRAVLADFGFRIGDTASPRPFGHFKVPYLNTGDYMAYVRFHAAWPIECMDPGASVLAYGPRDAKLIVARKVGGGVVVVVGDTCFAMNKNLEHENGEPFEGMRENADFWRWLLSQLRGRQWVPAKPPAAAVQPAASEEAEP